MLSSLALLWLVVANGTCDSKRRQQALINSYQLIRFELAECKDMGGDQMDSDSLEKAVRLSEEIDEMLAREKWSRATETMPRFQQAVTHLLDRLKDWDPDRDGLSNYAEFMLYGTLWTDSDSDGDGFLDGSEIFRYGTDPLDYCALPLGVILETTAQKSCPALKELK